MENKEIQITEAEKQRMDEGWERIQKRFETKPFIAETETQKQYLNTLKTDDAVSVNSIIAKVTKAEFRGHKHPKQIMEYDDAKRILWRIMNTKLANEGRTFEHAGNDLEVIQNLLKYFIGDNSSAYDLRKGICLAGGVGMGKTFLMESFMTFTKAINGRTFRKVGTGDVYDDISGAKNPTVALKKYYHGNVFFDDLGNEPAIFQHFGNVIAYMDRIMFKREEANRVGVCITHFTTNLKGSDISQRYGQRFMDRFKKELNVIVMTAPSKRN